MHRQLREKFSVTLRTSEGHQFRGEFGNPGAYPRPRKELQNLPHRALVTSRAAIAKSGDLVLFAGVRYLLAGQHILQSTKRFLAVEVQEQARWERTQEVLDPVTRMSKGQQLTLVEENLPVAIEPTRSVEEMKFAKSQIRLFTAGDVQLDDVINGRKVTRVDDLFGIKMVEAV